MTQQTAIEHPLYEEVSRILVRYSTDKTFDPDQAVWLIRDDVWHALVRWFGSNHGFSGRLPRMLCGIRVRVTARDEIETPRIQLATLRD